VRVRVHLARRARRLIGRHSRVVMHLTLASSDTGAVAVPRHWALTLRPPLP
jgi:hypothetical protein